MKGVERGGVLLPPGRQKKITGVSVVRGVVCVVANCVGDYLLLLSLLAYGMVALWMYELLLF